MTQNHHTPISTGAARNASSVNTPLGDLDSAITENRNRLAVAKRAVDFRLTLTTATPVTIADVSGAANLYFTPYKGNAIALYDGSDWEILTSAEVSKGLGGLTASANQDIFAFNNGGAVDLEFVIWSTNTARATALALQNGIYVKSGDATRRYVGTIRTDASSQGIDTLLFRHVWNYYNRVLRLLKRTEATDSWAYTTAAWRYWNNSSANAVSVLRGVEEDPVIFEVRGLVGGTSSGKVGLGIDSSSANSADLLSTGATAGVRPARYQGYPGIGRRAFNLIEYGAASATFFGDNGDPGNFQTGAVGWIWG